MNVYKILEEHDEVECVPEDWIGYKGKTCGACSALIRVHDYPSCNEFCAAQKMRCIAAWDDEDDGECSPNAKRKSCAYKFTFTSDAVCQCIPSEYRKFILVF